MKSRGGHAFGALLFVFSSGCAATSPASRPLSAVARAPIEVAPVVISPYTAEQLAEQFERGRTLLLDDKPREAAEIFDRLLRFAPSGATAAPSLFTSGVAHEENGELDVALARFDEVLRRFPDDPMARSATFRRLRVLARLERWPRLADDGNKVAALGDLSVIEAIEARGLVALALVEQDKIDEADHELMKARDLIAQHRLGEAGKPPLEVVTVSFALGEIRRKRSESIVFVPVPANFGDALERRCTGLLDAQRAYTDAMRALDARWSTMAGYRVGQLYQQLHRDVMKAPPPSVADTLAKKQLFEGAMRLRYRVLLEKGLKMMEGTVQMAERTGESSEWVKRAKVAQKELELALEDEKAAMSKMPFSEDEIRIELDKLNKK
jgi:tetratricopeptide (TPR) repeat protein